MKWYVGISATILLLLNIYDFYTTTILMGIGIEEANPYMRWVMKYLGIVPTLLINKGVFIILLCWASYKACTEVITHREGLFVIWAFLLLNTYYAYFMYTRNYQHMLIMF